MFSQPKLIDLEASPLKEFHVAGVNAFFRVLSNNLNHQNALADKKANIMISINTVFLSLVIGSSARNLDYWQNLLVPLILFVVTALLTTCFAVLATRPNIVKGKVTQDDMDNKVSTMFFFGNFTSLSLKNFEDSMLTILREDEFLYRSILADFYGQGKVLKRKYRLLSISYNIFLIGLSLSVVVFGIFQYFLLTK